MPYWNHLRRRGRKIICSPPRRWPVRSLVPRELLFSAALVTVFVLLLGVVSLLPRWVFLSFWMPSLLPYPGEYICVFCASGCCLCHPTQVSIFVFFCAFGCCLFTALVNVFLRFWVLSLLPWWVFVFSGFVSLQPGWVCFALLGALFGTLVSIFVFWGCCLSIRHSASHLVLFCLFPFGSWMFFFSEFFSIWKGFIIITISVLFTSS